MAKLKHTGLGSLYIILAIHVVLIIALSPLTNAIPPVEIDHIFDNAFTFAIAPNVFADCTVRTFLFYVDDAGNKRQGSFDFQNSPLFTTFDLVSRATGITIDEFQVDTFLKCEEDLSTDPSDLNFDLVTGSRLIYIVEVDDKNGDTVFVKNVVVNPLSVETGRGLRTLESAIDVQNKEIKLATFTVKAEDIEAKIDPNSCSIFGCATGSTATQSFRTQVRIITDYSLDFDILNVDWRAFGIVDNGYNVNFVDTDFSGTVETPKSTDIIIKTIRPIGGVFSEGSTRVLSIEAFLPDYQSGEGLPTMTVINDDTKGTISSSIMTQAGTSDGSTKFVKQIILPSTAEATFKVKVSIDNRVTAVTYVTTESVDGGVDPPPNNGGGTICTTQGQQNCRDPTCESSGTVTSSLLGLGKFCVEPNIAWVFAGFNPIWISLGIILFLIVIVIVISIAGGGSKSQTIVRSAVPTGF